MTKPQVTIVFVVAAAVVAFFVTLHVMDGQDVSQWLFIGIAALALIYVICVAYNSGVRTPNHSAREKESPQVNSVILSDVFSAPED